MIEDLEAGGVRVFSDRLIQPGDDWATTLAEGLDSAETLLALISPAYLESEFTLHELRRATERGIPIIPIVLSSMVDLPPGLRGIQAVDLSSEAHYAEGLRQLRDAVPSTTRQAHPVERKAPASKGYVFLSYAEPDLGFVDRLKSFLKDRGYAYWDYRESDRDYHSALFLELEDVILRSVALACVLSPDWKRSKWSVREFFFADEAGKPYFLLMARAMGPTLATAGMTYIDFEVDPDEGFRKLDRELVRKGL